MLHLALKTQLLFWVYVYVYVWVYVYVLHIY